MIGVQRRWGTRGGSRPETLRHVFVCEKKRRSASPAELGTLSEASRGEKNMTARRGGKRWGAYQQLGQCVLWVVLSNLNTAHACRGCG